MVRALLVLPLVLVLALASCEYHVALPSGSDAPAPDAGDTDAMLGLDAAAVARDATVPSCDAVWLDPAGSPSCPTSDPLCRRVRVPLPATWLVGPNPRSSADADVHEVPGGRVVEIDAFEVTVARYRRFVEANGPGIPPTRVALYPDGTSLASRGKAARATDARCTMAGEARDAQPINCIDWNDANAFCAWDGGRLLTRAELEYVRRWWDRPGVPVSGSAGRWYPWGDDTAGVRYRPRPASFPLSDATAARDVDDVAIGCVFGIAGGVGEWLGDEARIGYADGCLADGFCEGAGGVYRSVATGSWMDTDDEWLPSSAFGGADPSSETPNLGVRCAYDTAGP